MTCWTHGDLPQKLPTVFHAPLQAHLPPRLRVLPSTECWDRYILASGQARGRLPPRSHWVALATWVTHILSCPSDVFFDKSLFFLFIYLFRPFE